jgi:hypothetical protein|tara:strand:- start:79 stop:480 length:402 start_codon:yes stop_codon:yes gene_type:complete
MENDMAVTVEKLTKAFIKMRERRAELSTEFKSADAALSGKMDKVKQALLDYCKEQNVESVKTSEGTFFRTIKNRFWTSDWESMHAFIIENNVPHFLDRRLNQVSVRQFLEENPEKVPMGLNSDSEYVISVRKK